jgi:hypothetical protein
MTLAKRDVHIDLAGPVHPTNLTSLACVPHRTMRPSARRPGFVVLVLLLSMGALFTNNRNRIPPAAVLGPYLSSLSSGQQQHRAARPSAQHPGGGGNDDAVAHSNTASFPEATAYADTAASRACHRMFPWPLEEAKGSSAAWNRLQRDILSASHSYPPDHATSVRFQEWVRNLQGFYTADRLRRSRAHSAPSASIRRILELIQRRLDDPLQNDPVRIMVMGGSVAKGVASCNNHIGLRSPPLPRYHQCAWPARLGHLLNSVLFRPQPGANNGSSNNKTEVFDVWNAAVPGFDSEMGALLLEYQLFDRFPSRLPHVVLASYSANDAQNADPARRWRTAQQEFVKRVHRVRPCDDDLPLLVLVDDLYGDMSLDAIEQTGSVYKTSSWYNLMSIAYSNVGRHAHVAYHRNNTRMYPLFGSDYKVHLGIGFHVAMAWTVLFNIVDALYEACVGDAVTPLLPTTPFSEPNTKHRGRYGPTHAVRQEWEANLLAKDRMCNASSRIAHAFPRDEPIRRYSTGVCAYGWVAGSHPTLMYPGQLPRALAPVLAEATGWRAKGTPQGNPRTGWYAESVHATFSIVLANVSMETTSLTVLSMKSYGPEWVDSKLSVQLRVTRRQRGGGVGDGHTASRVASQQNFTN